MQKTVKIICKNLPKDEQENEFPIGISLLEIYQQLNIKLPYQLMAARVNYKVEDLNFLIYKPKTIEFIDASSPSGFRVYLRTISMILAKAVFDLDKNDVLRIEHPIGHGYYCTLNGRGQRVDNQKIAQIKKRMQEIIAENLPIVCREDLHRKVIDIFKQQGNCDVVSLLEVLGISYARYFEINGFYDYYSSVLAISTGFVKNFDLQEYKNGILLRVPDRENPNNLAKFEEQTKLFEIFDEFTDWNNLLSLRNVGEFNQKYRQDNHSKIDTNVNKEEQRSRQNEQNKRDESLSDLIKVAEALHEKRIADIADEIRQRKSKIVLVSGPSSSGKTTFSKRLSIQLMVAGIKPIVLSMDNYFVNRTDTPLDENGEYDFEHINAVDLQLFNQQVQQLFNGEKVEVPFYNFEDGKRYFKGNFLQLGEHDVLLIEGIHALNPMISQSISPDAAFKVYVSCLTTISLDNHNWISTTDTRLLRRIVRDYKFRHYSALDTLKMWGNVRRGEDKWIFPYQENADVMFNSALIFELSVLRKHAEPILEEVPQYSEEYTETHRLLKFLKYFCPIPEYDIPRTSLLREFLGKSGFNY
ncbi:MAG: nucleoside kinase [Prevotellaceae bacterium]|jgi:uridine kinase|nr:nucleoside kinase [Prevotellaceae bacterium]